MELRSLSPVLGRLWVGPRGQRQVQSSRRGDDGLRRGPRLGAGCCSRPTTIREGRVPGNPSRGTARYLWGWSLAACGSALEGLSSRRRRRRPFSRPTSPAGLPFVVRKRSDCAKRRTVVGELCQLATGETEVWLGAISRVGTDEAELTVVVHTVSCRRRLRREAGTWRMLTPMEVAGLCRVA